MKCKLVAVLFTLLMAAISIANTAEAKFTGAPAKRFFPPTGRRGFRRFPGYTVNQIIRLHDAAFDSNNVVPKFSAIR